MAPPEVGPSDNLTNLIAVSGKRGAMDGLRFIGEDHPLPSASIAGYRVF